MHKKAAKIRDYLVRFAKEHGPKASSDPIQWDDFTRKLPTLVFQVRGFKVIRVQRIAYKNDQPTGKNTTVVALIDPVKKVVLYEAKNQQEARFRLAHELAHYLLGHCSGIHHLEVTSKGKPAETNDSQEWDARQVTAEILVPSGRLRALMKEVYGPEINLDDLSGKAGRVIAEMQVRRSRKSLSLSDAAAALVSAARLEQRFAVDREIIVSRILDLRLLGKWSARNDLIGDQAFPPSARVGIGPEQVSYPPAPKAITAKVFDVLIASGSELKAEREAIYKAIHDWNCRNAKSKKVFIVPRMWERDSYASVGVPQEVINKQFAQKCHGAIVMVWTRLGVGTQEEFYGMLNAGRPVALLFCVRAVAPSSADYTVKEFKAAVQNRVLFGEFDGLDDLVRSLPVILDGLADELNRHFRNMKGFQG